MNSFSKKPNKNEKEFNKIICLIMLIIEKMKNQQIDATIHLFYNKTCVFEQEANNFVIF